MGKIKSSGSASKKRGKNTKTKSNQADIEYNKLKFRFFAAIIAVAVCVPVFWVVSSYVNHIIARETEKSESQEKMRSYLRYKYGEEFTVSNIRREGAGLGVAGQLTADASSADGTKFEVGQYSSGVIYDDYISVLWSLETNGDVKNVKNIYEDAVVKGVKIEARPIDKETGVVDTVSDAFRNKPRLSDTLKSDPASVYYSVYITQERTGELDEAARRVDIERVRDVTGYLDKLSVGRGRVRSVINVAKENFRYICNVSWSRVLGDRVDSIDTEECFTNKYKGVE